MAHFLLLNAPYYKDITDALLAGATQHLTSNGHSVEVVEVPGAFELPIAIQIAHDSATHYDGYVALGCVIRGETTHYDYVCGECARGVMDLSLKHRIAIGFGVLTVENKQQADVRADINGKNKGKEAAEAALQVWQLQQQFAKKAS